MAHETDSLLFRYLPFLLCWTNFFLMYLFPVYLFFYLFFSLSLPTRNLAMISGRGSLQNAPRDTREGVSRRPGLNYGGKVGDR